MSGEKRRCRLDVFIAEKWVDQVIEIDRYNARIRVVKIIVVKLVVGDRIMNIFSVYAFHSCKIVMRKREFLKLGFSNSK